MALAENHEDASVVESSKWPDDVQALLTSQGGLAVKDRWGEVFCLFEGDTKDLNQFMELYAALEDTALTAVIHPALSQALLSEIPAEATSLNWVVVMEAGETETVAPVLHVFLGEKIALDAIEVPLNVNVMSGREIEEFVADHEEMQRQTGFSSQHDVRESPYLSRVGPVNVLRALIACEVAFQMEGVCDEDGDGQGEFGFFQEMTGAVAPRDGSALRRPGVFCPHRLGILNAKGQLQVSGYLFQIYLPDGTRRHEFVTESDGSVPALGADKADEAEYYWICYAWPVVRNRSGVRAFVVSADGSIFFKENGDTSNYPYDGPDHGPDATAAFIVDAAGTLNFPDASVEYFGSDGDQWFLLQ